MGHHLSVPSHHELVSTCHHWLALHSSRRTEPAETRLERDRSGCWLLGRGWDAGLESYYPWIEGL